MSMVLLFALVALTSLPVAQCAVDADLITDLPGLPHRVTFKQYSGHLQATGTKKFHYWFVESAGNPKEDPLVLWLNGGPGCSSLDGLLTANGPFNIAEGGEKLVKNPYSWNKVANMLYLESPAGVGFSYSDNKNYTTSDDEVALDNYEALKYFMAKFPEFSKNEFYLTGESYAGIYLPTLAMHVVADPRFNFKGMAVGNGVTDTHMLTDTAFKFAYYHGLFGNHVWRRLLKYCCRNGDPDRCNFQSIKPACQNAVNLASAEYADVNMYNIYQHCYHQPNTDNGTVTVGITAFLMPSVFPKQYEMLKTTPPDKLRVVLPCLDLRAPTAYLNRRWVRRALHIPHSLPNWRPCNARVNADYLNQYDSMREQYLKILSTKKQRILVYNGDVDMMCNFMGDEQFVDSLKVKPVDKRKSWHFTDDLGQKQVAGFVSQFEDLTFVTVKGSGHVVPQDKPHPAFEMFERFLKGQPY